MEARSPMDQFVEGAAEPSRDEHQREPRPDGLGVSWLHVGLPMVHLSTQDARGPGVRRLVHQIQAHGPVVLEEVRRSQQDRLQRGVP